MIESLGPFDLRDERNVRGANLGQDLPRLPHVIRPAYEAQRDHVDAEPRAELQVVDVLRRHCVGRKLHAGRVDALVLFEHSAFDDSRDNFAPAGSLNLELNLAVVEEQPPTRARLAHEFAVCRVDVLVVAISVAGDNPNRLPVLEDNRAPFLETPRPDFRAAQVLKYRHDLRRAGCSRADPLEGLGVRLVRSVGKIEPAYVDPGADELLDDFVGATCRADSGDDLCMPHAYDSLHRQRLRRTIRRWTKVFEDARSECLSLAPPAANMASLRMRQWRRMAC